MTAAHGVQALNLSVSDIEASSAFYSPLFPGAEVRNGTFAGINYRALMGDDGEVDVCFFQKSAGTPLADSFPTIMVDSVESYLSKIEAANGRVLIPVSPCPCTGAPFAICEDGSGNQLMVKQPRS